VVVAIPGAYEFEHPRSRGEQGSCPQGHLRGEETAEQEDQREDPSDVDQCDEARDTHGIASDRHWLGKELLEEDPGDTFTPCSPSSGADHGWTKGR
jgi:hypothetical protein